MNEENKRPHFIGHDYNNQELRDAKSLQLNQDAVNADEAVRKSQSEQIANQAAQDILTSLAGSSSNDTAFTSAAVIAFLSGKQDNMEIDSSSTAYLQIIDGYKIKATQLLITDVEVNETYATLTSYIAGTSPNKQQGDVVILTSAANNQERSWIKTGSASQNADGYTRLQTDYNVTSIRAMFSAGSFIDYDTSSGQIGVNTGTGINELGAQTLPINDSTFQQASGTNILDLAKSLESLILNGQTQATQATTTVDSRISSCTGVSGSNLGNFGGRFSDDSTIKDVLAEAEQDLTSSESDRASIRSEFAAADSTLQSNINAEASARISADNAEASARLSYESFANSGRALLSNNIIAEETRATVAENALGSRLDTIEGASNIVGSIAKAQADAQTFATNAVNDEASSRANADANLQTQIDALQGAFLYKGFINAEGRVQHIDVTDPNHNVLFESLILTEGHFYKVNADLNFTFGDSSTLEVKVGDAILGLNDVASGNVVSTDLHVGDNTESADLLREGQLEAGILERDAGTIKITENSLGYGKLQTSIKNDIDDKVSLTQPSAESTIGNTHVVITDSLGVAEGTQIKFTSLTSSNTDAPNGTQRMYLDIHKVYSGGNGNPTDGSRAVIRTQELEYHGDCADFSQILTVDNAELNYHNANAKTLGTSRISRTSGAHLGISTGHTASAEGSLLQNIGNLAHAQAIGVSSDIGEHGVLSNFNLETYAQWLAINPLSVAGIPLDAAVVADARTATSGYAHVSLGRPSYFDPTQPVTIPSMHVSGSTDNSPVSKGDIKSKEYFELVDINAVNSYTVNHQLDSDKLIISIWFDGLEITSNLKVEETTDDTLTLTNLSSQNLTGIKVCIYRLTV